MVESFHVLLVKKANELADAEKTSVPKIITYISAHGQRNLITTSGEVKLNVPKLKGISL